MLVFLAGKQGRMIQAFSDHENGKDDQHEENDSFFGHMGRWVLKTDFKGIGMVFFRSQPKKNFAGKIGLKLKSVPLPEMDNEDTPVTFFNRIEFLQRRFTFDRSYEFQNSTTVTI